MIGAWLAVACPTCAAQPDDPCRSAAGAWLTRPHRARVDVVAGDGRISVEASNDTLAYANNRLPRYCVDCPTCDAKKKFACVTPVTRTPMEAVHRTRWEAYDATLERPRRRR